jgi:hypothetical protein
VYAAVTRCLYDLYINSCDSVNVSSSYFMIPRTHLLVVGSSTLPFVHISLMCCGTGSGERVQHYNRALLSAPFSTLLATPRNYGFFKHTLTQFVVLCKYLPREGSTVNTNFSSTLCTNYVPFFAFWAAGKCHTSNIHQAPHGPDLAIITPLFTLIPLERFLRTILASSRSACTHTNL